MIDAYLSYAATYKAVSDERVKRSRRVLLEFAASISPREVHQATSSDLRAFLAAKLEAGFHPNTVRQYRGILMAFVKWLWRDAEAISADAYLRMIDVESPHGSSQNMKPNPYKRTELAAFWATLDRRYPKATDLSLQRYFAGTSSWRRVWRHIFRLQLEAVVALALDMGLRKDEIHKASLDDLHYDNEYVVVVGKGEKPREVPFTVNARARIEAWVELRHRLGVTVEQPWLVVMWDGDRSLVPLGYRRFGDLPARVGGPYTLHRFRHTFATERLRAGMRLENVQKLLGHATMEQTRAYAEIARYDLSRAMEQSQRVFEGAVLPPSAREAAQAA